MRFIAGRGDKIAFSGGWAGARFPPDLSRLFPAGPESEVTTLAIDVSGVRVHGHFFSEEAIEFDLDPADVGDPSKLDAVFNFMKGLASAIGKDVLLTPENVPEMVIFRCRPQTDHVEHRPFGGMW